MSTVPVGNYSRRNQLVCRLNNLNLAGNRFDALALGSEGNHATTGILALHNALLVNLGNSRITGRPLTGQRELVGILGDQLSLLANFQSEVLIIQLGRRSLVGNGNLQLSSVVGLSVVYIHCNLALALANSPNSYFTVTIVIFARNLSNSHLSVAGLHGDVLYSCFFRFNRIGNSLVGIDITLGFRLCNIVQR